MLYVLVSKIQFNHICFWYSSISFLYIFDFGHTRFSNNFGFAFAKIILFTAMAKLFENFLYRFKNYITFIKGVP